MGNNIKKNFCFVLDFSAFFCFIMNFICTLQEFLVLYVKELKNGFETTTLQKFFA